MSKDLEGFVARLTALGGGSGDSRALYDDWAATYEDNLQGDYGYVAPAIAVTCRLPALISSGSPASSAGDGPMPSRPFSVW